MNKKYGEINITRTDIRSKKAWSLDMRDVTGGTGIDDSQLCSAGTFLLSVCAFEDWEVPIGEIRIIFRGVEVSIVGHPTGRQGVIELTPEHLSGAMQDTSYRASLVAWIQEGVA